MSGRGNYGRSGFNAGRGGPQARGHHSSTAPHIHCTPCSFGICNKPRGTMPGQCRFSHPGDKCKHGVVYDPHSNTRCQNHVLWEYLKNKLNRNHGFENRDAECMANVVLDKYVQLVQHESMPPSISAPLSFDQVDELLLHDERFQELLILVRDQLGMYDPPPMYVPPPVVVPSSVVKTNKPYV